MSERSAVSTVVEKTMDTSFGGGESRPDKRAITEMGTKREFEHESRRIILFRKFKISTEKLPDSRFFLNCFRFLFDILNEQFSLPVIFTRLRIKVFFKFCLCVA